MKNLRLLEPIAPAPLEPPRLAPPRVELPRPPLPPRVLDPPRPPLAVDPPLPLSVFEGALLHSPHLESLYVS